MGSNPIPSVLNFLFVFFFRINLLNLVDLFIDFTVKQLILNNIYIGHRQTVANASVFSLLVGNRNGVDFFDVRRILVRLRPALKFVTHLTARRGIVLFNNPDRRLMSLFVVQKFSTIVKYFYFTSRKLPGILTNFFRLRGAGFSAKFKTLKRFPAMVFSVNFYDHHIASEAAILGLPVLNIYDTNTNFYLNHSYNVPGNDDSYIAHRFYYNVVCRAILKGLIRFSVYRRIRVFKKIKKFLHEKKKFKILHLFQQSLSIFPLVLGILQVLGLRNMDLNALKFISVSLNKLIYLPLGIGTQRKSLLTIKNKNSGYKEFSALREGVSIKNYSQIYLSTLNEFLIENSDYIEEFSSIEDSRFNLDGIKRYRSLKLKTRRNLSTLTNGVAIRLFSFSPIQKIVNRNLRYLSFVRLRKSYFFKILKKFYFFINVRKTFFYKFRRKKWHILSFSLFQKLITKAFYRYLIYLYIRRFQVSSGSPLIYKRLAKQFRRKTRHLRYRRSSSGDHKNKIYYNTRNKSFYNNFSNQRGGSFRPQQSNSYKKFSHFKSGRTAVRGGNKQYKN